MTTANFTKPVVTDLRADVLQYVRDYMAAQAKMFDGDTLVSQPTNTMRWSSANSRFEKWDGTTWQPLGGMRFDGATTVVASTSPLLSLQAPSSSPWALELKRTDLGTGSKVFNDNGSRWAFEHRPIFAGNLAVDAGNVGSYAPSPTGTGASGTWGISVTGSAASASSVPWSGVSSPPAITGLTADTAATANTVARRDSSGYLFGAYFNQSSSNNENPTISQVMVTNGSDGFFRKAGISALATAVQGAAGGSWPINVTGNAATASSASSASAVPWSGITSKPTTLSGFGITDAYPLSGNPSGFLTGITSGQVTGALGFTPYNSTNPSGFITSSGSISGSAGSVAWSGVTSKPTTLSGFGITDAYPLSGNPSGFLTGITSGQVTTALGFTPYNATNPSGFITSAGSISGNAATASAVAWSGVTSKPLNSITTTTSTATPTGGTAGDMVFVY